MEQNVISMVERLLLTDRSVTDDQRKAVLAACQSGYRKRKLVTAKEAMKMLQISRPTLRQWCREGKLSQVVYSPRKIRFDSGEIERLMFNGPVRDADCGTAGTLSTMHPLSGIAGA